MPESKVDTIVAVLRKKDQAYERWQSAMRIGTQHQQEATHVVYMAACLELAELIAAPSGGRPA